jgi:hypothetical protein
MKISGVSSRGESRTSGNSGLGEETATDEALVGEMGCFVEVTVVAGMLIDGMGCSQAVRKAAARTTDTTMKSRGGEDLLLFDILAPGSRRGATPTV